ncbi:hypothetical protein B0T26DRAFT_670543 [Lasiosphaeria miniovina]|uniref:Uncharacterized protein n=1 Tax=Lasiosphaeria miniovina TaxID=1954250 RepID=A0AA40BHD4_9PEZI|nr:uncharacterized protein B0T26DRAFT_670543 [Lasiosphaeria miniovina]KAK0734219.1 hypothetical protein B0T26DRAFT_670543 [Lasiosphaeria miniovina]
MAQKPESFWSPGSLSGATRIPRRYVLVPKSQQTLLERQDAWALSGFPNIPAEVLQNLRDHCEHLDKEEEPPASHFLSQPEPTAPDSDPESQEENGDDRGTPIPWTPSPVSPRTQSPVLGEARSRAVPVPVFVPPSSPPPPSLPPSLSLPLPAPKSRPSKVARHGPFPTFPPSSGHASEIELEVEVPRAITDVVEVPRPIDGVFEVPRATTNVFEPTAPAVPLPEPTPPSAQSTLPTERTSISPKPPPANTDRAGSSPKPPPAKRKRLYPSVANFFGENPDITIETNSEKIPPNGPPSQVPYTAFTLAYPDYQAGLTNFIRGVIYIHELVEKKALAEFLFDDFVRVFCGDFLAYIASRNEGPVLSAIHYYNENISRPQYTKGVLTKSSINDVLDKYPKEVRSIEKGLADQKSAQTKPRGPTPTIPDPHSNTSHANDTRTPHIIINQGPEPTIHIGELASDPIDTSQRLGDQQRLRDPRKALSRTGSNATIPRSSAPRLSAVGGPRASSSSEREDIMSRPQQSRPSRLSLDFEVVLPTQTATRSTDVVMLDGTPVVDSRPARIPPLSSGLERIPETTIKTRGTPRRSKEPTSSVNGSRVTKAKSAVSEEALKRNFRTIFLKHQKAKAASSAPES